MGETMQVNHSCRCLTSMIGQNGTHSPRPMFDQVCQCAHSPQPYTSQYNINKNTHLSVHRSVKLAVNWRCVEYEQLISQIDLVPEYYEVVRVFTA